MPGAKKGRIGMEWFKFRMSWMKVMLLFSDEEIGRVFKGLAAFFVFGEEQKTGGKEDILLCMMFETLKEDIRQMNEKAEQKEHLRKMRSDAGRKGGIAKHANEKRSITSQPVSDIAETC